MANVGEQVILAGWVQTIRKFGSITFLDLRDRYGVTQILLDEQLNAVLETTPLGREYVLQVQGVVTERSNKNPQMPTGDIEITCTAFTILNKSETPPFTIEDNTDGGDELRMKYRYLDLRRAPLRANMELGCGRIFFQGRAKGKSKLVRKGDGSALGFFSRKISKSTLPLHVPTSTTCL